ELWTEGGYRTRTDAQTNTWMESRILLSLHVDTTRVQLESVTYSIWNLHGEQLEHASSSNATRVDSVQPTVDANDQVMDIIQDVFPFASTNMNQEEQDDVPTPIDSAEFEQYEKLLKNANQEL
ncbi:unnamed protein product, partial [Prunus brigantina]